MQLRINRRQFGAGAAATALTTILPGKARAATPQWQIDSKVEVGGHNPQVSGGPTVATGGHTLLSVYVGEGGKNLWYSYAPPSFTWEGNKPITYPGGNIVTSSGGRPGLSYVSAEGHFLLVVPGHQVLETWKYDFTNWVSVGSQQEITELQFSEPALGDGGDRSHLLICNELGVLWWYSRDNKGGNWVNQTFVANGKSPSITLIGDTLHALYWDTDQKAFVKMTLPHGSPSWQSHRVFPQGQTPDQGAAIGSINGQLYVVYTLNGNNLQCAALNADFSLGQPQPIAYNGHAAATHAVPAVTAFENSLVVLHQGESSDNLWFTVRH